jgi:hypothetical protein
LGGVEIVSLRSRIDFVCPRTAKEKSITPTARRWQPKGRATQRGFTRISYANRET